MEDVGTETLRKLAPCWSLAGDERLLTILQNTHKRLLARCQEANTRLEDMATALGDASIRLQNVNNQFMALSSSQFIESRVYEDDADAVEAPANNETPKSPPQDELSMVKRSISVIERNHEVITIVNDSDTSDSDDEIPDRQVMKAKDMYADRPLPYIIGSEPWKNKWHAGLVLEDSDTESSTSKVGADSEQYSQSEPEDSEPTVQDTIPESRVRQSSESSSEVPSEATPAKKMTPADVASEIARRLGAGHLSPKSSESSSEVPSEATPAKKMTPADVASEIARRLGAGHLPPKRVEDELQYEVSKKPVTSKLYRPQEPVASTIFSDEPPPLEEQADSDTDIFADLRRQQPYQQPYDRQDIAQQLFGTAQDDEGDIFSDFTSQPSAATKPTSLFDAGPKPQMFEKKQPAEPAHHARVTEPQDVQDNAGGTVDDKGVKKPVGGISLFGSNKGAESIGAAILKRNQRKSSSSDDGETADTILSSVKQQPKKEKDIFDDLFAKAKSKKITHEVDNIAKDIKQKVERKSEEKIEKVTPKPVDLFSDNLFDDIDDIFTDVVKTNKDRKKLVFEDDDDLFAEVANSKVDSSSVKNSDNKKSLFDSDDDLFTEKPTVSRKPETALKTNIEARKTTESSKLPKQIINKPSSLFDDDEKGIFSDVKVKVISANNLATSNTNSNKLVEKTKNVFNSPSLFDDDDEDVGDLFKDSVKSPNLKQNKVVRITNTSNKTEMRMDEDNSKTNAALRETDFKTDRMHENIDEYASLTSADVRSTENIKSEHKTNVDSNSKIIESLPNENLNCITKVDLEETVMSNHSKLSDNVCNEQDFDDAPMPESTPTTISSISAHKIHPQHITFDTKTIQTPTKPYDVVNSINSNNVQDFNSSLKKDIFMSTEEIPNIMKTNVSNSEIENNIKEPTNLDIYSNILLEPPIFEKPKEPKRSKNVNALFDDDSDDEALFFKKDDVVFDDNPEEFTTGQDKLYNIFTNVPPEVGFNNMGDDNLFRTLPQLNIPSETPADTTPRNDVPSLDDEPTIDSESNNKSVLPTTETKVELQKSKTPALESEEKIGDIFKLISADTSDKLSIEKPASSNNYNIFKLPDSEQTDSIINEGSDDIFKQPINSKSTVTENNIYLSDNDDDEGLFKSLPLHLSKPTLKASETIAKEIDYKSEDEQFQSLPNLNKPETSSSHISSSDQENQFEQAPAVDKSEKKVGKLKMGLNINVKALLPGASPKKVKVVDNVDGQTQSNTNVENANSLVQPVAFEGKPESEILDNKLSKERPRIQVKRRPSTRKARKEAVRKSAIDFGEDSTDNSSSVDDSSKVNAEIPPNSSKVVEFTSNDNETLKTTGEHTIKNDQQKNEDSLNVCTEDIEHDKSFLKPIEVESQIENVITQPVIQPSRQPVKSNSTTKIVYILNDEDIFNTNAIETTGTKNSVTMNLSEENSALFETKNTKNISEILDQTSDDFITAETIENNLVQNTHDKKTGLADNKEITIPSSNVEPVLRTLGKTYQDAKNNDSKSSLFNDDDDDDEKIFKNKKPIAKVSIFDSDSDEELFGVHKKTTVKKVEHVLKKGSLFDDDEDEDLFGVKTKKTDPSPQSTRSGPSVKDTPKPTQTVFEDPLSMFGDEV